MDEVIVNQTKYISSKRAAKLSGYARDYIGQLVRMGKLKATKVGRAWFVDEKGIIAIISGKRDLPEVLTDTDGSFAHASPAARQATVTVSYPKTWSQIHYMPDDTSLFPTSDSRDLAQIKDIAVEVPVQRIERVEAHRVEVHVTHHSSGSFKAIAQKSGSMDGIRVSVRDIAPKITVSEPVSAVFTPVKHISAPAVTRFESKLTSCHSPRNTLHSILAAVLFSVLVLLIPII